MIDQLSAMGELPGGTAAARGPLHGVATIALAAAGAALVSLTLVEAWQVFARYVLDSPPAWTEPVALLCLKCALMFAAAVGVRDESHFRFLLGVQAARGLLRHALQAGARVTAAALGLALAGWGARMMLENWSVKMPGAPLPSGLYFAPFVAGGVLFALFAVERLLFRFEPERRPD
jgi:TRAP-type C4-dicarboxylate transport system permease small subunit